MNLILIFSSLAWHYWAMEWTFSSFFSLTLPSNKKRQAPKAHLRLRPLALHPFASDTTPFGRPHQHRLRLLLVSMPYQLFWQQLILQ